MEAVGDHAPLGPGVSGDTTASESASGARKLEKTGVDGEKISVPSELASFRRDGRSRLTVLTSRRPNFPLAVDEIALAAASDSQQNKGDQEEQQDSSA